ncbi:MAG: VWA domain-containing protein [Planctomycetota bacterium]|nr:MAG: VWA domain-containing protein [Planctomycetota bacterium]
MQSACPVHSPTAPWISPHRKGVILVLASVAFFVLIVTTALSIDTAYVHLTRTELRVATDAAAKAGAEALLRTQTESLAVTAAQQAALSNTVSGRPLQLTSADVLFGNTALSGEGQWAFQQGVRPYNSVKINSAMSASNANGAVPLFFAGVVGQSSFEPSENSIATVFEQDVLLCIDRSHSMCFDLSGTDWIYPSGLPWYEAITRPPHSSRSRWASLNRAVSDYLSIANGVSPHPRISLVTWASKIGTDTTEYKLTGKTSPATTVDTLLLSDYTNITKSISKRSTTVMLGGTNMAAGLDLAVTQMQNSDRPLARKVIVLMTDGQWNQGRSPLLSAEEARAQNIVIHTVSFLPGAQQNDLESIAEITGGRYYHADSEAELREAFRELATSLPVVLTE